MRRLLLVLAVFSLWPGLLLLPAHAATYTATARPSSATPAVGGTVEIVGTLRLDGRPVAGTRMQADAWLLVADYPTRYLCNGVTDAAGTARCSYPLAAVAGGLPVTVQVTFPSQDLSTVYGQAALSFTPRVGGGAAPAATAPPNTGGLLYPIGTDVDCRDFPDYQSAQRFYEASGGVNGSARDLDGDHDGIACEDNPGAPRARPATATPRPAPRATATPVPSSGRRIGAICRDGWRSNSTGSGTCSGHGGVDHWLYAP